MHRSLLPVYGLLVAALLHGCAMPGEHSGPQALSCTLPSNCVSSLDDAELVPLRYEGTTAQALVALETTLATFAEARVVHTDPLQLQAVFTTPVGFRDEVDFRIDPARQRIDFRSRSLLGLFDFGKNRARMQEFSARFATTNRH